MATLTQNLALLKLDTGTAGWGPTWNAILTALDGLAALGPLAVRAYDVSTTTGLSTSLRIGVAAGVFVDSTGAYVSYAGTGGSPTTLTASVTTYVWLTDTGTLTTGSAFPGGGTKIVRLAVVVTGGTTITSITDARVPYVSAG